MKLWEPTTVHTYCMGKKLTQKFLQDNFLYYNILYSMKICIAIKILRDFNFAFCPKHRYLRIKFYFITNYNVHVSSIIFAGQ